MATGFTVNGVDLDDLFAPRAGTTPVANTGFTVAGQDLADRFRASTGGDQIASDTGFTVAGIDLRAIFRDKAYAGGTAPSVTVTGGGSYYAGQTVTLTANATGTGPLSYQWYYSSGNPISGATSSSYSWYATDPVEGGTYSCTVTNAYGADSDSTTVSIYYLPTPPSVTVSGGGTITAGETASFSASATGTAPLSYEWSGPHGTHSGADWSFTAATGDSGTYTCTVTNSAGSDSDSVSLTVNPVGGTPPTITAQWYTPLGSPGTGALMSVDVSGTAPFSYQWYNDGPTYGAISGATSNSYTGTYPNTTRSYSVTVSNAFGNTSASFTLHGF